MERPEQDLKYVLSGERSAPADSEQGRVEVLHGSVHRGPAGQGGLGSPVDAVTQHEDCGVLAGDDSEGVSNGTAGRLPRQRVSLVQRLGQTVGGAVGSVPVPTQHGWYDELSLLSIVLPYASNRSGDIVLEIYLKFVFNISCVI